MKMLPAVSGRLLVGEMSGAVGPCLLGSCDSILTVMVAVIGCAEQSFRSAALELGCNLTCGLDFFVRAPSLAECVNLQEPMHGG